MAKNYVVQHKFVWEDDEESDFFPAGVCKNKKEAEQRFWDALDDIYTDIDFTTVVVVGVYIEV